MKKSYLLSLSLAAALAVPAFAQQTQQNNQTGNTQTSTTPASTTQNAQTADTTEASATGKQPLTYERHEGFWGKMNPFARKKYVNRQLDPVRGRVNELDELTAKNAASSRLLK